MRWNRRKELQVSRVTHGLLALVFAAGFLVILRELPALRRYMRIERM